MPTLSIKTFIPGNNLGPVLCLCFPQEHSFFSAGFQDGTIICYGIDTGKEVYSFSNHRDAVYKIICIKDYQNNMMLLSASLDRCYVLWNIQTQQIIKIIPNNHQF